MIVIAKDLTPLKVAAKAKVDAAAEQQRLIYITPGSGQAMVYDEKAKEATAFQTDPTGTYPLLEAEVGITAADIAGVATTVLAMASQWKTIAAGIEAKRLAAKAAIDAATTPAAIDAAANVSWS